MVDTAEEAGAPESFNNSVLHTHQHLRQELNRMELEAVSRVFEKGLWVAGQRKLKSTNLGLK